MKSIFVCSLVFISILSACNKGSEDVPKLCMLNKSGHPVYFWRVSGGRWMNFYNNYCEVPFQQNSLFEWRVQFPGNDFFGTGSPDIFTRWEGTIITGTEDINFEFTDQSGTVVYDFRDSIVGDYTFVKTEIELSGPDTLSISTDTLPGKLSKDVLFNQLKIDIGTSHSETAIFDTFLFAFYLEGHTGNGETDTKDKINFISSTQLPNGHTLRRLCSGKKL
jgi:hypothetical protein